MRRAVIFVLVVLAFVVLSTVRLSKGEPGRARSTSIYYVDAPAR